MSNCATMAVRLRKFCTRPFGGEPDQRLAHRRAGDPELLADIGLVQQRARHQLQMQDLVLELLMDIGGPGAARRRAPLAAARLTAALGAMGVSAGDRPVAGQAVLRWNMDLALILAKWWATILQGWGGVQLP